MGRLRRSRHHLKDKSIKKVYRLSNRTKDMDQRWNELQENPMGEQTPHQNPELPGLGQHYCIHCDRHFIAADALVRHKASKVHKRRVRDLKERPFDPELDPC